MSLLRLLYIWDESQIPVMPVPNPDKKDWWSYESWYTNLLVTWRWDFTWDIVKPLTSINWSTSLGVASVQRVKTRRRRNENWEEEEEEIFVWWLKWMRDGNDSVLSWPPSLWMALTKRWWRSGVHLRRGSLDLVYCLTAPFLPQFPILPLNGDQSSWGVTRVAFYRQKITLK